MARTLDEVIASARGERRGKIAAAYGQKLLAEEQTRIAVEKRRRLEEAKRVLELDRNLIALSVIITALPIIAALAWMLTALAVGDRSSSGGLAMLLAILRASSLLSNLAAIWNDIWAAGRRSRRESVN